MAKQSNIRKLKNTIRQLYIDKHNEKLKYHGFHHVLAVLASCDEHIKRLDVPSHEAHLLRAAALLHDTGILWTYNHHENKGIEYTKSLLPEMGYNEKEIEVVCQLIKATELPQTANNLLEEIICDADLDYLGTDLFYPVGNTLFQEFLAYDIVKNEKEWDELQIRFLEKHSYFTDYCKRFREPEKQKRIQELKDKWNLS